MKARITPNAANDNCRAFGNPAPYLAALAGGSVAHLLQSGSDITLVLSKEGHIEDLAYRDPQFGAFSAPEWTGRPWSEVVTAESVEKVASLLTEASADPATAPPRQINHPGGNGPDLPVRYRVVALPDSDQLFAFGENLSDVASAQSRLVQAQMELEADYRKLRDTEARYRTVFQMANRAVLVVDGASRSVLDANRSAARLFEKDVAKLVGDSISSLLDRASRKEGITIMTEAHYQGSAKTFRAVTAPGSQDCLVSVEPFRENGQNNLLIKFDRAGAVPEAQRAAEDLHLLHNHPEGAVLLDSQGNVIAINEQFLDLVQSLNKDRLVGRHLSNWLGASTVDTQVLLSKLRKEERVASFATVVRGETGSTTDVVVSASAMAVDGGTQFLLIISEDIRRPAPMTPRPYGSDTKPGGISELVGRVPMKELIRDSVDVIEKMCIEAALNQTNNNRASAADLLGLSRQSLYIKLKRYGLEDFGED